MSSVFVLMRKRETLNIFWSEERALERKGEEISRETEEFIGQLYFELSQEQVDEITDEISKKYSVEEFEPWE